MGTITIPLTVHIAIIAIAIIITQYLYNKYDREQKMKHTIIYTENEQAGIVCSNTNIDDPQVIPSNAIRHCQYCGAKIKLYWDVRIKEV